MDEYIQSLLKDFFEEAFDMLDRLEQNILVLEKDRSNVDAIQEIFRAVHTLKGSAGAVELFDTQSYAHVFEDLLDLIRDKKIVIDDSTIDVLLKGIDILKELIECAKDGVEYSGDIHNEINVLVIFKNLKLGPPLLPNDEDATDDINDQTKNISDNLNINDINHNLENNIDSIDVKIDNSTLSNKKIDLSQKYAKLNFDSTVLEIIRNNLENSIKTKIVNVEFNTESPMKTVGGVQVFVGLKDFGDVIYSVPSLQELEGDEFYNNVTYILETTSEDDEIIKNITFPEITEKIIINDFLLEEYELHKREEANIKVAHKEDKRIETRQSSFLRVESDRIDAMMNQVGELVTNKSSYTQYDDDFTSYNKVVFNTINEMKRYYKDTVLQMLRKLEEHLNKTEIKYLRDLYINGFNEKLKDLTAMEEIYKESLSKFRTSYQLLTRVTNELQETVMKIRMVPIAQTFNRFPRLIRDLSKELGKEVELEMYGEETELDKSVIEVLVDPLVHIIRNAIDHGVEMPEEREAKGKSRVGKIVLSASHEGNLIIIKISDDGKGMIPQKIFESAVKKGLVDADAKLTEQQMLDYIFAPGFSTAERVTNISGRGVGMDVVNKSLERINGSVGIETKYGEGSTFILRIPLTVAIVQALIIDSEKEFYAIPINSILETIKVDASDIHYLEGTEVINIRDDVINVLSIKELFKLPSRYKDVDSYYAVILSSDNKQVALLVNNLIGEQDIVIKTLKNNITKSDGVAGATILGDGTVSFILDIQTIVALGSKRIKERVNTTSSTTMGKDELRNFINKLKNANATKQEEEQQE